MLYHKYFVVYKVFNKIISDKRYKSLEPLNFGFKVTTDT